MKCTKMLGWLVMAAALSFTACSSEDNLTQEPTTQQPTETATNIHVSVGAGIDNAATRSTVDYNSSTKTRTLKFTTGDKLYIYRDILGDGTLRLTGELTMKDGTLADDGLSATFEGDLRICDQLGQEATYDFGNGDPLTGSTAYLLHEDLAAGLYTILSNGSVMLNMGEMAADDVVTLMTTALVVTGQYNGSAYQLSTTDTPAPILNCTIAGLTASQTYGFKLYKDGKNAVYVEHDTDASGTATFAFASLESGTGHWTLDVKHSGTVVSSIDLGNRELTSKVYNISRYWYGGAMHRLVDLGNVNTSTHPDGLTLQDGDAVTGLLDGNNTSKRLKISIANGASVILNGVDIRGYDDDSYMWAGLTCAGDATIILADGSTNTVKGFYRDYPGIFIAEGKTLTIQGSGSLTAAGGGGKTSSYGAGIGGAKNIACGNIVIGAAPSPPRAVVAVTPARALAAAIMARAAPSASAARPTSQPRAVPAARALAAAIMAHATPSTSAALPTSPPRAVATARASAAAIMAPSTAPSASRAAASRPRAAVVPAALRASAAAIMARATPSTSALASPKSSPQREPPTQPTSARALAAPAAR